MMKQEGEKKQITNIEKGGGDITTDPIDTERKTEYCKLYSNRSDILTEMEKRNPWKTNYKIHEERKSK